MGAKAKAPPPPDYSEIAEASKLSAQYSFQLGKEQLAWAKEQYGKDSAIIKQVVDASLKRQTDNDKAALADRERYEERYQPIEDALIADAESYASPERQEQEAGKATATVAQQFDAQRKAASDNLEAYGVDPSSTRYAAIDMGSRVQQAAAQAGAGNQARTQTDAMGRALRSEALNVGRGYPGQVAGTYGTALQSGNQAVNAALSGTASGAATMGTAPQWQNSGQQALQGWGNTLSQGYDAKMAQYNANQQSSSGLGALAGAAMGMFSFEEGGAVPGAIPAAPAATRGGNVPPQASPTRGAAIDDVSAKLNVGEFVVPQDVVSWKGEEFFQKMIEGSRKAKPQAPAQPEYSMAPPSRPTFSTTQQQALPVG